MERTPIRIAGSVAVGTDRGLAACRADAQRQIARQPAWLAGIYAVVSMLWLGATDMIFEWTLADSRWRPDFLVVKGALFVLVSALVIYLLQRRAMQRLRGSLSKVDSLARSYAAMIRDLPMPCLLVDPQVSRVVDANEAAGRLYGWPYDELRGQSLDVLVPGLRSADAGRCADPRVPERHRTRAGAMMDVQVYRTRMPMPEGLRELWLGVDVSLSRQADELWRLQSRVDPLTGLANRAQLRDRLIDALAAAQPGARLALLLVDIDQFKLINGSRGHASGDAYLREVASRLSAFSGPSRLIGRFGGDEFLVLMSSLGGREEPMTFAEVLRVAVSRRTELDGMDVSATCSVGVAVYPDDGNDADSLLGAADTALGQAKRGGRNMAVRFTPRMRAEASRKVGLIHRMRQAIEQGEMHLRYQPQFSLDHSGLVGIEALSTWTTAEGVKISAGEFIPVAESSGQIIELGFWVFGEALKQLRRWQDAGWRVPPLAVNVSPSQLQSPGFAEHVIAEVERHRLDPGAVELEITETMALHVDRDVQSRVRRLAEAGLSMVIDDFGRGYSSLSHFTHLPIHKVKIDASFVRNIERSRDKQAIVRAMLSMADALGLHTMAEGVEREAEASWLLEHGCRSVQGYLYARPGTPEQVEPWLDRALSRPH